MACASHQNDKILDYTVHCFSSCLSNYAPEKIQENKPSDQLSRWSSDTNSPPQFLVLKLNRCSVIRSITFGKYEKTHVCNLKKFKVYGGMSENNMVELLEGGLLNDSVPEMFALTHKKEGFEMPCRYLKIVPLLSWGPSFNFSIWFVELRGEDNPKLVKRNVQFFHEFKEKEAIRLCLKHFRQRGPSFASVYEALRVNTGIELEDPKLTALHNTLVLNADYAATEEFMAKAVHEGLLDNHLLRQDYTPQWKRIMLPKSEGEEDSSQPGMRGGHQMCIDPVSETIFLFGGWDGTQDLSDLWQFHIPSNTWKKLSSNTEVEGGPSARSCHKMCLDPEGRQIFTLGRYLDNQYRSADNLKSDFYVYHIETGLWTLINEDTATVGGPQLIFDHQICMDSEKRTIYVFGGRILTAIQGSQDETRLGAGITYSTNSSAASVTLGAEMDTVLSGMFSFHIPSGSWQKICDDLGVPILSGQRSSSIIRARVGHSMLFHPGLRELFIFAGQRRREYLNDFFAFNVDTYQVRVIWNGDNNVTNKSKSVHVSIPATGYTQRATIDPELDEIYVLSGLSKDKERRDENVQNSFWVYSLKRNRWSCIYRNENTGDQYWSKMQNLEPCPRFAHQLVYSVSNKIHYLFGGNPGKPRPKLRLDDFWQLKLCKPTKEQLLLQCRLMIRKHRFKELAAQNTMDALDYLQTSLHEIIDHDDPESTREFQKLASELFRDPSEKDVESGPDIGPYHGRTELFDDLSAFFSNELTQPHLNLIDLLPL
ncbi:muskelin [Neocloeon triangulifer]|uniref:muskelin n=1 Tax=Neocloeon triangulifer TaxID=2078957 RepID=UPI00286EC5DD|nr:muskelin [Neocloeon triangulifer]